MEIKELTEKEFKSAFSEKMNDVTDDAEAVIGADVWEYVKLLEKSKYFINDRVVENRTIEKVYRNSINTCDQILIPTLKKNVFLIIIINLKNENIFGHYLLDLNKEYGSNAALESVVNDNDMRNADSVNGSEKSAVQLGGTVLFEIGQVKRALGFDADDEKVEILVFETSSEDDFVKLKTKNYGLGIKSERAYIEHVYHGFHLVQQNLLNIEINGVKFPCDLLNVKNDDTGETKKIYFEIGDFFYNMQI